MARTRIPPRLSGRKWYGAYVYETFNRTCQSTKAEGTAITGAGVKQLRKYFHELGVEESKVNEMIVRFFWTHTGNIRKEEVVAAFRQPPEEDNDGVEFSERVKQPPPRLTAAFNTRG
jgi:hypothetical protein